MTLHAQTEFSIPEETIRVAHAAYPHLFAINLYRIHLTRYLKILILSIKQKQYRRLTCSRSVRYNGF